MVPGSGCRGVAEDGIGLGTLSKGNEYIQVASYCGS